MREAADLPVLKETSANNNLPFALEENHFSKLVSVNRWMPCPSTLDKTFPFRSTEFKPYDLRTGPT